MTLVYLVAAWLGGIVLAAWTATSPGVWLALAVVSVGAALAFRASRRDRLTLACLCFLALGATRYSFTQRPLVDDHVARHAGRGWATLVGVVDAPPDVRDSYINLRVRAERIGPATASEVVSGCVLVQVPRATTFHYGDRVLVSGSLLIPPDYDDFSYRDYLARRGIHALLPAESVEVIGGDAGSSWLGAIYSLRERSIAAIGRMLPSPQAPLLTGILLGDESGIPADVREAFNRTGAAHVLAISGANIAILLRVLMGLLLPFAGRRHALWLSSALVVGYVVLVGGDPAVVRAAIMGLLALVALQTGRRAHGLTSLAFAVWLMSLQSPTVLWDIGFQLSVAATAGLILFTDDFTRLLNRGLQCIFPAATAARLVGWLTEPLVVSLAAQIATTPLILFYFGRLSVASLLANLLIVSIQPYIMILGWIALGAGLVWLPVGEVLAWIVWLPLTYMLWVVEALARFSWASVPARLPGSLAWVFYTVLLVYALIRVMHRDDRRALAQKLRRSVPGTMPAAAGAVIALLLGLMTLRQPDGRLHVWFLDVGEGASVLIETPRGAQFLVDGGESSTRLQAALGRALPFYDRALDAVILTKPDADAVSALSAVFARYSTEMILLAASVEPDPFAGEVAEDARVVQLQSGHVLRTDDGVEIESIVSGADAAALRVTYGDASFLLGFGLTSRDELRLLESGWHPRSVVLQVPGGGSQRANVPAFLTTVQPQVAVVPVAAGNRAGLPHPAVLEWLDQAGQLRLYRTDRDGTIEVITDGVTLEVRTAR